jgi:hypothetical protein
MIAIKKNEKKRPGSDVDSDSKHSEDSDESSVKKWTKTEVEEDHSSQM